ncbi:hypothetical protein HNP40_001465 [Mycobacteroides chelonae]|nr:hypothetical protein [Mycobacteroides chelonae]
MPRRVELLDPYLLGGAGPRRAQERGQLRSTVDPEIVVDQLWGACYHRLLVPDQPLTEEFVDALLDNLFAGPKRDAQRGIGPARSAV